MTSGRLTAARLAKATAILITLTLADAALPPALVLAGTATPPVIDVAGEPSPGPLGERLLVHKEPGTAPATAGDADRILALPADAWHPATLAARSSFFQPATLWLLGRVDNGSKEPITRLVTVEPWWLADVQLFVVDPQDHAVLSHQSAGLRRYPAADAGGTVEATFPVDLLPGQQALLLVRVADPVVATVKVGLFEPVVRHQTSKSYLYVEIALLGFVLALVVVLIAQGTWPFVLVATWLTATTLFELSFQVPLVVTLFPGLTPWIYSILTMAGSAKISLFALSTLMFLGLYRQPFWRYAYLALIAAIVLASAISFFDLGLHRLARETASALSLLFSLIWPLAAWAAWGVKPHRPYQAATLALFSAFWLALLVRTLIARGHILTDLSTDPVLLLYLMTLIVLALGILRLDTLARHDAQRGLEQRLREQEEAAQRELLAQRQQENLRLAAAVEAKTQELRIAIDRAEASSREKSAFLSIASHELRAPLHDLLGYAQLLARCVPAECRDQLTVIRDSGRQLLHLIDEMLEFSRGEAKPIVLEPAPLSLRRLAMRLTEIYRPQASTGNNLLAARVDIDPVDWVLADEKRLMQILRNLLENACKFTHDGEIELRIELAQPRPAAPDAEAEEVMVRFAVIDTGIGILPANRETVFQPFSRVHAGDATPGLGLGLTIAHQLAVAMGGLISVQSNPGAPSGSRFELALALQTCAPEDESPEPRLPVGYSGRLRTILIADDAATSRRFLVECCEQLGFRTLVANDGAEALAQLRSAAVTVDLALVDQVMPALDGWGFLRAVRESERDRHLPVVLVSAASLQPPPAFPSDIRFDEVAMKPLSEESMAEILGRLLDLDWTYDESLPMTTTALATTPLPYACPAEEFDRLRQMVSLGQLLAIQQWAQGMAERYPPDRQLFEEIARCSTRVDLAGLRRIAGNRPPA